MQPTTRVLFVSLALSWFAVSAHPYAADPDPRILRVEQWLKAVLDHEPGAEDEALTVVAAWSNDELQTLWIDQAVLVQLMRNPRRSWFTIQLPDQRSPQQIRYTPQQLQRLKVLACAAGGILTTSICTQLNAAGHVDSDLRRLAELASASRFRGDDNYVLRRGALLHTDVAMSAPETLERFTASASTGPQRILLKMADGRVANVGFGAVHWEIARLLLGAVTPAPDSMVRLWYRATAAWMHSLDYHETVHLAHARRMFPQDADFLFLSGCQHETYARPATQAAVDAADLPAGFRLGVGSDRAELGEAENYFRRALRLNPAHTEAHVRLGRVLFLQGRYRDAAVELRQALAQAEGQAGQARRSTQASENASFSDEDLLQYYGSLFLGAAEEAVGAYESAAALYRRAAELYPDAQSPYLAFSALARRRGDRAGALRELQRLFDLPVNALEREDPWWTYHVAQGRDADALLEELRRPFIEAPR